MLQEQSGARIQAPPHPQAKLVRCGRGVLFDMVVDIRRGSPSCGQWVVAEQVDIRDRTSMNRILASHAPDAVIHLAPESHVDRSIDVSATFVETNVLGTFHLLEARGYWSDQGRPAQFRFHHISVDEVFGLLLAASDQHCPRTTPYADLITFVADRPGHDQCYAIDLSLIRDELSWRSSVTLAEGLDRTVRWYRDNPAWGRVPQARAGVRSRLGIG